MENLTHSLLGATLASIAVPRTATVVQRRVFFITGLLAANLPDADLVYSGITPPPLGYLLHHRGHTHTIAGLVAFAALAWLITRLPRVREAIGTASARFWWLVALALGSHLLADGWNNYGIHPFFPLSNQWFYGDVAYILEPWFWMLLGVAVVLNTRNRHGRWSLAALLIALPLLGVAIGMLPWPAIAAMAGVCCVLSLALRTLDEPRRALISLVALLTFVVLSWNLHGAVVRQINQADPFGAAQTLDLILNPRPANPLCWDALRLTRDATAMLTISQRTVALPSAESSACGRDAAPEWRTLVRESIPELQQLARDNCEVRAWLQFGRAPALGDGLISDLRFGAAVRGNFSALRFTETPPPRCPPNLPNWTPPRSDVLDRF
ncbi:MAG: metal-dependent hydrolase [Pseudomonadales bacterium]|jgi:inner membrane protein|nr:metal-dependent hydrolase [Pseudomonadales bacterium]